MKIPATVPTPLFIFVILASSFLTFAVTYRVIWDSINIPPVRFPAVHVTQTINHTHFLPGRVTETFLLPAGPPVAPSAPSGATPSVVSSPGQGPTVGQPSEPVSGNPSPTPVATVPETTAPPVTGSSTPTAPTPVPTVTASLPPSSPPQSQGNSGSPPATGPVPSDPGTSFQGSESPVPSLQFHVP
jgi:hypothetical protein